MARAWTEEQKAAASVRAKSRNAPVVVTEEESFLARMHGSTTTREDAVSLTGEQSLGQDNSITVEHKSSGTVVLYERQAWGGWAPRTVPRTSVSNMLASGWRITCGDCNGQHSGRPNDCPGREPLQYRVCPQAGCSKEFFDIELEEDEESPDDPMRIVDAQSKPTTSAERTMSRMNQHIRAFHEGLAYERGLMNPGVVMAGR